MIGTPGAWNGQKGSISMTAAGAMCKDEPGEENEERGKA
jgi:hypothetical protein